MTLHLHDHNYHQVQSERRQALYQLLCCPWRQSTAVSNTPSLGQSTTESWQSAAECLESVRLLLHCAFRGTAEGLTCVRCAAFQTHSFEGKRFDGVMMSS